MKDDSLIEGVQKLMLSEHASQKRTHPDESEDCNRAYMQEIINLVRENDKSQWISVDALKKSFMQGYEAGHHDTVESGYTDAGDVFDDWYPDAVKEGILPEPQEVKEDGNER